MHKNHTLKNIVKKAISDCLEYDKNVTTEGLFKEIFEYLLELERDTFLGYPRGLKEKVTDNKRNGYYERIIKNLRGSFSIHVPRDRKGEFIPLTLEMLKKDEDELKILGYKLYAKGMTTRDISEVFENTFGISYSPQMISNITQGFEHHRLAWQNRILESDYYFIYIDALYTKIRRTTVSSEAIYVVIGLKKDLTRDVLGIYSIPQESASGWKEVFKDLQTRGVKRFLMCIADGLSHLEEAVLEVYPKAMLQKCVVHKIRNILVKCRPKDKAALASDLRSIFDIDYANHTFQEAEKRIDQLLHKWEKFYPMLSQKFDPNTLHHYFEYLKFPPAIRRLLYTTNWIERLNKHLRKVERNKNSFPNEESAINLMYMSVIEFEEKVYKYKVSSFFSSQDILNNMLHSLYPSSDT